jgi:hypothetical protein
MSAALRVSKNQFGRQTWILIRLLRIWRIFIRSQTEKKCNPQCRPEWQRTLSGVLFIMMEKLAQAGEGWDARPTHFTINTITYKVEVCTLQLSGQIHPPPPFHLYPDVYSVV